MRLMTLGFQILMVTAEGPAAAQLIAAHLEALSEMSRACGAPEHYFLTRKQVLVSQQTKH
jgi:hypothetical protein